MNGIRCEHRLTYSFDQCENEATRILAWSFPASDSGEGYRGGSMHVCASHCTREAEMIQDAGGSPRIGNL